MAQVEKYIISWEPNLVKQLNNFGSKRLTSVYLYKKVSF